MTDRNHRAEQTDGWRHDTTLPSQPPCGISVVVIVRNEQAILPAFLDSVRWADEMVVVDDHSSDSTFEIARKYTNKVYQKRLINFAEQKNFAVGQATCKWILALDADEVVGPALRDEILSVTRSDQYTGYLFPLKNLIFGHWIKHGGFYPFYRVRLFMKGRGRWVGRIHERVEVEGPIGTMTYPLEHDTVRSTSSYMAKRNLFSDLEAEELFAAGVRVGWWALLYRPVRLFLGRMLLRGGVLDGVHGTIWHGFSAIELFLTYAKLFEKQRSHGAQQHCTHACERGDSEPWDAR